MRKPTFRATPRGRRAGRASGSNSLLVSRTAAAPFIRPLVMSFRFCIVSRPLASRGAPERHVYCCWLRVRNGFFLTRNQAYYTRTPSGGTLGACATRQGGVGGGRASSPDRLAARSRGVKRVALRHSRAGGMAVGGAADFDALEGPMRNRSVRCETHAYRKGGGDAPPFCWYLFWDPSLPRSTQCPALRAEWGVHVLGVRTSVYNSPQETETWCPLFTQSHVTHGEKWGEAPKRSMHVLNRRVFETDDIVSMSRELSRGTFPRARRRSGAAISHGAASSATPRRPPRPSLARGCLAAPTRPQRVRVAAKRGGRGEGAGGRGESAVGSAGGGSPRPAR